MTAIVPAARAALLTSLGAIALAAAAAVASPQSAQAAVLVSSNWAGYAAHAAAARGGFQSVSGTWTQPAAGCTRGRESYVGVWVGLGGYAPSSRALEQIGTDSDCTRAGQPVYSAWFELVPAQPVSIALAVHAGDRVSASVTVRGHHVTLRIRDLTSGARFGALRRTPSIDVSSAEWIVEAPSTCLGTSTCATLPLTNFGTATFSSATATAAGRTAGAAGPGWATAALELRQSSSGASGRASTRGPQSLVSAVPSPLAGGGAFSVAWAEQPLATEAAAAASYNGTRRMLPRLAGA